MNIREQENFRRRVETGGEKRDALNCSLGLYLQEKIKSLDGADFTEKDFPGTIPWFLQVVSIPLGYARVKLADERKGPGYWTWGYMIPQDKKEEREIEKIKKQIPVLEAENEILRKNIQEARG